MRVRVRVRVRLRGEVECAGWQRLIREVRQGSRVRKAAKRVGTEVSLGPLSRLLTGLLRAAWAAFLTACLSGLFV